MQLGLCQFVSAFAVLKCFTEMCLSTLLWNELVNTNIFHLNDQDRLFFFSRDPSTENALISLQNETFGTWDLSDERLQSLSDSHLARIIGCDRKCRFLIFFFFFWVEVV